MTEPGLVDVERLMISDEGCVFVVEKTREKANLVGGDLLPRRMEGLLLSFFLFSTNSPLFQLVVIMSRGDGYLAGGRECKMACSYARGLISKHKFDGFGWNCLW